MSKISKRCNEKSLLSLQFNVIISSIYLSELVKITEEQTIIFKGHTIFKDVDCRHVYQIFILSLQVRGCSREYVCDVSSTKSIKFNVINCWRNKMILFLLRYKPTCLIFLNKFAVLYGNSQKFILSYFISKMPSMSMEYCTNFHPPSLSIILRNILIKFKKNPFAARKWDSFSGVGGNLTPSGPRKQVKAKIIFKLKIFQLFLVNGMDWREK